MTSLSLAAQENLQEKCAGYRGEYAEDDKKLGREGVSTRGGLTCKGENSFGEQTCSRQPLGAARKN